jgi:hypothetical protein
VGAGLKSEILRLKCLHQNPTRFALSIPPKLKLSKLNLADNLLIGAISYLLYFSKPLALCSCIASIFRDQLLVFHGFWDVMN